MKFSQLLRKMQKSGADLYRKRLLVAKNEPKTKNMAINKIKVHLPAEINLYQSQKLMIIKILKALEEKEHALIESPTGSGKTLALLSAACSWLIDYNEKKRANFGQCPVHFAIPITTDLKNLDATMESEVNESMDEVLPTSVEKIDDKPKTNTECTCRPKMRIYYCTRTHKQIAQVVKEYKRLPFWLNDSIKHTILASREQSCINQDVRQMEGDLNTNCRRILEPKSAGCTYRDNLKNFSSGGRTAPIRNKMGDADLEVWDIEELISALPKAKLNVCPYYLTNIELTKDANLIFLPYNYLLDPVIRDNSDVYLKNSIIIIDEGHNIEDVSRNAASFEFTDFELGLALHNLNQKMIDVQRCPFKNEAVENYYDDLFKWHTYLKKFYAVFAKLTSESENMSEDKFTGKKSKNFDWNQLEAKLSDVYLFGDEQKEFMRAFDGLTFKNDSNKTNVDQISDLGLRLNSNTIICLEKLLIFFKFHSQADNRKLYKGNLEISKKEGPIHNTQESHHDHSGRSMVDGHICQLNLWSMLPSTAFNEAFSESHSVILASGTLSPFDTFSGELGLNFKHQMEGAQVIDKDRIFARSLSTGPTGKNLHLTYNNMNDAMMTELAQIIADVCKITPHGVLAFVSSYRVLQQIKNALYKSKLYREIQTTKEIFYEPKGSKEMNKILEQYEEAIARPRNNCNGALMIAVFRGKVSEGLDFADNKARAVICFGIPYPSLGDQNVMMKRGFNDVNSKSLSIVDGSTWYEVQAFRALNQALGRCLRHRNDWGALIMVDTRYSPQQKKISSWVRHQMKSGIPYGTFKQDLKKFIEYRKSQEPIVLSDDNENDTNDEKVKVTRKPFNRQYKNPVFM